MMLSNTQKVVQLAIILGTILQCLSGYTPFRHSIRLLPRSQGGGNCMVTEDITEVMNGLEEEIQAEIQDYIIRVANCSAGSSLDNPATSCADIPTHCDSGEYWVTSSSGTATKVYCDTTPPCCNSSVTSMRVALLNMSDPNQQCPDNWREIESPRRSCRRQENEYINSVIFPTHGVNYSQICGRIIAYQYGIPEAFLHYNQGSSRYSIDDNFVDGVTISYGTPRNHVWTFACTRAETTTAFKQTCSCSNIFVDPGIEIPPWVGQDYFCETGIVHSVQEATFYSDDPLWDGRGCGDTSECCSFNNPPWFCKRLPQTTNADIEVRLMGEASSVSFLENEDTPVELIELYIQ